MPLGIWHLMNHNDMLPPIQDGSDGNDKQPKLSV
jgi:hypothetical protein